MHVYVCITEPSLKSPFQNKNEEQWLKRVGSQENALHEALGKHQKQFLADT